MKHQSVPPEEAGLFALPPTPPLKRAKSLREADRDSRPTWSRYRPKNRIPCDECMRVLHEAEGVGPYARAARWKRTLQAQVLVLCNEHADAWKLEET